MAKTTSRTKEAIDRIRKAIREKRALSVGDRIEFLQAHFGVSLQDLAEILGVDQKTLAAWKSQGFVGPRDSVRFDLVFDIVDAAYGVLRPMKEYLWYKTPNPALRNYIPINLLKDPQGLRDVKNVLERRKWGIPA